MKTQTKQLLTALIFVAVLIIVGCVSVEDEAYNNDDQESAREAARRARSQVEDEIMFEIYNATRP